MFLIDSFNVFWSRNPENGNHFFLLKSRSQNILKNTVLALYPVICLYLHQFVSYLQELYIFWKLILSLFKRYAVYADRIRFEGVIGDEKWFFRTPSAFYEKLANCTVLLLTKQNISSDILHIFSIHLRSGHHVQVTETKSWAQIINIQITYS